MPDRPDRGAGVGSSLTQPDDGARGELEDLEEGVEVVEQGCDSQGDVAPCLCERGQDEVAKYQLLTGMSRHRLACLEGHGGILPDDPFEIALQPLAKLLRQDLGHRHHAPLAPELHGLPHGRGLWQLHPREHALVPGLASPAAEPDLPRALRQKRRVGELAAVGSSLGFDPGGQVERGGVVGRHSRDAVQQALRIRCARGDKARGDPAELRRHAADVEE
mmetsp:Transcript_97003/g.278748  ORF Transcript_97003/g.278748 Transcript_97003/m.278748 type:complete len:219 (-) Transcript_97003:718-1374(-)